MSEYKGFCNRYDLIVRKHYEGPDIISKYDTNGNLIPFKSDNILPGDTVLYLDSKSKLVTDEHGQGSRVRYFEKLVGIWNGSYVQFDDVEKTVVRNINWLKKEVVIKNNW